MLKGISWQKNKRGGFALIRIEKFEVVGFEAAIRGLRNPKNSWAKSDSHRGITGDGWELDPGYVIGDADKDLMLRLAKCGPVHAKYRRMIVVYVDITAPLYWWKEFDTYKVGTVANSCSTMHKIHEKEFTLDDFSHEHLYRASDESLTAVDVDGNICYYSPIGMLEMTIKTLNYFRDKFNEYDTKPMKEEAKRAELKKEYWWQMIQLLPSSYNQKRTVMLNYEVLAGIWEHRRNHKLDEWRELCKWIETLPYSEVITL